MKKSTLIKMGAGALVGAAIGFGIDTVIKKHKQKEAKEVKEVKTTKEVVKENVKKMSDAVELVAKISCVVCVVYAGIKVVDYISEVDTKATVSNMLSIINGAKLGLIDKEIIEYMIKENVPSLDETSKKLVEGYALSVFPDLLGGVDHE